ncbi:MAG: hypothetical protein AABZ02_07015 [Bacteroidota bacterium]|jgi:HEPN domain-containing protein
MGWIDDVKLELVRAEEAREIGNAGKARTSARRAAGIAISELQRRFPQQYYGEDFIRQLRSFAADATLPEDVRGAAARLHSRLSLDFESQSENPVADAMTIIEFIRERLG